MSPYRAAPFEPPVPDVPNEECVVVGALIAVGAIRLVFAIADGEVFGTEPTIALIAIAIGVGAVVRGARKRVRAWRSLYRAKCTAAIDRPGRMHGPIANRELIHDGSPRHDGC